MQGRQHFGTNSFFCVAYILMLLYFFFRVRCVRFVDEKLDRLKLLPSKSSFRF